MTMYKLLEYRQNYSKTTGSFWNYYKDEPSITGKSEVNNTEKKAEIVVPLKHLSNFWRTLDMPLINCEINLILTWSENCVITSKATRIGVGDDRINNPTNATF